MPSVCSVRTFLFTLVISTAMACSGSGGSSSVDSQEFGALEDALARMPVESSDDFPEALDALRQVKTTSEPLRLIQRQCVLAHEKYADAMMGLAKTRTLVAAIEQSPGDSGTAERRGDAERTIAGTTRALDQAEAAVASCSRLRQEFRNRLAELK